jgi:RimJ/RimL family protein N-acetyltransferase
MSIESPAMFQNLHTPRLVLRRPVQSDAPAMFAYRSDAAHCWCQTWEPTRLEEVEESITQKTALEPDTPDAWFRLAITLQESGALIGDCGLHFPSSMPQQAEIGITLAPAYLGKGYAAEALGAVLEYLFIALDKHRVFAGTDPANRPAIALLERCGLRREAHFKQSLWFKGRWADDLIYAILQSEWQGRK